MTRDWTTGTLLLDTYEVVGHLGTGATGSVHRVRHRTWGLDLALKTPLPALVADEGGRQSFLKEAETWVRLTLHPNVVTGFYVRTIDDAPCILMEWVDGSSLADWITARARRGRTDWRAILDVAIPFAWGLGHAHASGLVHQDVKPANVLVSRGGDVKVCDFGLARVSRERPSMDGSPLIAATVAGMTPGYCSPEQLALEPVTPRTDVFSWAASVLEMIVGERTWLIGPAAPDALTELPADRMPRSVRALLEACLAPSPNDRPADMNAVAPALRAIHAELTGAASLRSPPPAAAQLPDDLNNRALSMLDLDQPRGALDLFNKAVVADPRHAPAIYNRGLLAWRWGEMRDDELVALVSGLRGGTTGAAAAEIARRIAWVHVERGAVLEARHALDDVDPGEALREAMASTSGVTSARRHTPGVAEVAFFASGDGLAVLSGDGTFEVWDSELETIWGTRIAHFRTTPHLALSRDGRRAAVMSDTPEHVLVIVDLERRRVGSVLGGHASSIYGMTMSSDGRHLVSGAHDKTARLWDTELGVCTAVLDGHKLRATAVGCSADFAIVVTAGDGELFVWDGRNGRRIASLEAPGRGMIWFVQVALDGRRAVTICSDWMCGWDLQQSRLRWKRAVDGIPNCAASPDASLLARQRESRLRLVDPARGRVLQTVEVPVPRAIAVRADPTKLAMLVGKEKEEVMVWSLPGARTPAPPWFARPRDARATTDARERFAARCEEADRALGAGDVARAIGELRAARAEPGFERSDAAVRLKVRVGRVAARGALRGHWSLGEAKFGAERVVGLKFTWTNTHLLALSSGQFRRLAIPHLKSESAFGVAIPPPEAIRRLNLFSTAHARGFDATPDGRLVVAATNEGTVSMWDARKGTMVGRLDRAITLDGTECDGPTRAGVEPMIPRSFLPAKGARKTFALSNVSGLHTFHPLVVSAPVLAPSGGTVLLRGHDDRVRLWRLGADGGAAGREPTATLIDPRDWFHREILHGPVLPTGPFGMNPIPFNFVGNHGTAFTTPDFRLAVTTSKDAVHLWSLAPPGRHATFEVPGASVAACDGTAGIVVVAGTQGVSVIRSSTGERQHLAARADVSAITVSSTRGHVLIGCADGSVELHTASTGKRLAELEGHTTGITSLAVSHDAQLVAAGTSDGSIRLWHLDWEPVAPTSSWTSEAQPLLALFAATTAARTPEALNLLVDLLGRAGFGWLDPRTVRSALGG